MKRVEEEKDKFRENVINSCLPTIVCFVSNIQGNGHRGWNSVNGGKERGKDK